MKKIIIIGGGVAGMSALWSLSKTHDVLLLEASDQIGGHAYSHRLTIDGQQVDIDMGVEYIHERLSPNFFEFIKTLQLPTYIAPLTFCAYNKEQPQTYYWSNVRLDGAYKKQYFQEMNRFQEDLQALIHQNKNQFKTWSVKDFLRHRQFSDDFAQNVLLPLLTTFSGCHAPSLDYSLPYIAISFNMNLLSFFNSCHWRKLYGGIHQDLLKLSNDLKGKIKVNSLVTKVKRSKSGVCVELDNGATIEADELIFACQADIALRLIDNPSTLEQTILSAFDYVDVESCLHTDNEVLTIPAMAKEYFQFELAAQTQENFAGYLTRVVNHLSPYQHLSEPLYVSFDRTHTLNPNKIITTKKWRLPKLRPKDIWQKLQVRQIQGLNKFWYCGSDYSLTGHEGAMVSGLVIANHLGANYPFAENWLAKMQFNTIKQFMGIYHPREKALAHINSIAFNLAKKLNLHKRYAHHVAGELLF